MRDIACDAIAGVEPSSCIVFLEELTGFQAGSKAAGFTMFKLGRNLGQWEGIFLGLGVRVELVRPQQWQRGIPGVVNPDKAKRKHAIRDQAQRLYPQFKKITLDVADAVMIMDYGVRVSMLGGKAVGL